MVENLGGDAKAVAREGMVPSVAYGGESIGIKASSMRDLRRVMAAVSRVRAGGSSTTSKLALGGSRYAESDPIITLANPPLIAVASKLWDDPRSRSDHVYSWRSAMRRLEREDSGRRWGAIRGPVDAAMAHLLEVDAEWPKPFVVVLLQREVQLLETPPKQVERLVRLHNRLHLDRGLLKRLGQRIGWDCAKVEAKYEYGIDWALLREVLNGSKGELAAREKRTLESLASGAFWPEARRWLAGLGLPTGTCHRCFKAIADERHSLIDCEAAQMDVTWARIAGRRIGGGQLLNDAALAPLYLAGLPPRLGPILSNVVEVHEGEIALGSCGIFYGDSSGVGCESVNGVVTWSLVQLARDGEAELRWRGDGSRHADGDVVQMMRGTCTGWFPSVPRGELTAMLRFARWARIPARYVGDCKYVTDAVEMGIPGKLTSSACAHADLWREAKRLLQDHGQGIEVTKTKAHRSRTRAIEDGNDGVEHWEGNMAADAAAKSLAKKVWLENCEPRGRDEAKRADLRTLLVRTAVSAYGAMRALDGIPVPGKRRRRDVAEKNGRCGDHVLVPRPGQKGSWCQHCRLVTTTPTSWRSLAAKPCKGDISDMIHISHSLRWSGRVLYCGKCGWYTSRIPRSLRKPCRGAPASEAARNVLRRLRLGLPPTTAHYHTDLVTRFDDRVDAHGDAHEAGGGTSARRRISRGDSSATATGASSAVRPDAAPHEDIVGDEVAADRRAQSAGGATEQHEQGNCAPTRRRIVGKQPPREGGDASERRGEGEHVQHLDPTQEERVPQASATEGWCSPSKNSPWTRRVTTGSTWAPAACNVCKGGSRLRCRQCLRPICLRCAKVAAPCIEEKHPVT